MLPAWPLQQPSLLTARLRLRPFTLADADDVQRYAGDPAVAASTLYIPHPYPDGAAAEWIGSHAAQWRGGTLACFAVTDRANHDLLGCVGLNVARAHEHGELGYWTRRDAWGHGYGTEAAGALCAFAFKALGLHRIQCHHFGSNPASGRIMQKLGMQREGLLRDAIRKDDRFEDAVQYAVLEHEWMQQPPVPFPDIA
jgi:[ribosomal protein S5]-alanine N-acetyltransferase